MDRTIRQALSHVIWIGGAPDSGKTSIGRIIAERHGLQVYHYDRHDLPQIQRLSETIPRYQAFLSTSLDERWVQPEPKALFQRVLQTFHDRFPLVIEDLLTLPQEPAILAEGFGFTPELLSPVLSNPHQAIWLVPTAQFKWVSLIRRNKPSFRDQTSDPVRATQNLLRRDKLLADHIKTQALTYRLGLIEIDGSRSAEQVAALLEQHFEPIFNKEKGCD
jgi:adenylate kinase family enzyme